MHEWCSAADACVSGLVIVLLSAMACFSSRGPLQRTEQTPAYHLHKLFLSYFDQGYRVQRERRGRERESAQRENARALSSLLLLQRERTLARELSERRAI